MLLFATNTFLMQGFLELERTDIRQQMERGLTALEYRVSDLDAVTHGLAASNDLYGFMDDGEVDVIETLVIDSTFIDSEINLMFIFSLGGELAFSKAFDLVEKVEIPLPNTLSDQIRGEVKLLDHQSTVSRNYGVLRTDEGPMIVASRPIITGKKEGPIRGTLVCVRRVDAKETSTLMGLTSLSLEILEMNEATEADYGDTIGVITESAPVVVNKESEVLIAGYAIIDDIHQEPALLFRVEAPRTIYQYGLTCIAYFVGSFLIVGITIGLIAMLVTDKLIVSRLTKLSDAVSRADAPSSESTMVEETVGDEIFVLTNNIRYMLEALKEYQFRLKESERMATIGELSAMVGHDLRNPIQVVYGLRSILQRKVEELKKLGVGEAQIRDIEYVDDELLEQMQYMNKIVSDLQDYAKTIKLAPGEVDIGLVIDGVLASIKVPGNIDVSIVFEEGFPDLYVDVNLMRRLYTNLINNAVQAMPDGGRLTIRGRSTEEHAFIDVEDTGVGISKEIIGEIFRPLFTTKAKGSGLGLSVCERIVESHGGEILVESEVGVGSTFTVRLPLGGDLGGGDHLISSIDVGEIADAINPETR